MATQLVPEEFEVPAPLRTDRFVFQVLGPEHNAQDQPAWTSSIRHIRATPGFGGRSWPGEVEPLSRNLVSLRRHRRDHEQRTGFSYAVLAADEGEYLGCVYFYPPRTDAFDVDVRSWVRADRAALDKALHDAVRQWLAQCWPWSRPDYAPR